MTNAIYENIYLVIVLLLTLFIYNKYNGETFTNKKNYVNITFSTVALGTIFFMCRPLFEDSKAYARVYKILSDIPFEFNVNTNNILFDNLMHWMANAGFSLELFFAIIAFLYLFCCSVACKKIFSGHTFLAFVVFLGAFSTYSYAVNGIKAGAAASVFMCAIAYQEKLYIAIPLCLASWGIHHSMHVCVAVFAIVFFIKNPKYYLLLWITFVFCSAFHFTFLQNVFADLTDEKGSMYFEISQEATMWKKISGFRYDFVFYSMIPIILGWKVYIKEKVEDKLGIIIFNIYCLLNSIWLMCMYVVFTNRIAYFSWSIYPIALLYPTLLLSKKKNSYKFALRVVTLHFVFTLAMHFIYYA